jgi:hypothetical protein
MNDDPWAGSLEPRPNEGQEAVRAILGPAAPTSGSQAFPVSTQDGSRWYAKAPNNPQGPRVLVTEYLVSEAGQLIGAPVCEVKPVTIPEALAGYQVPNGPLLTAGVARCVRTAAAVPLPGGLSPKTFGPLSGHGTAPPVQQLLSGARALQVFAVMPPAGLEPATRCLEGTSTCCGLLPPIAQSARRAMGRT